MVIINTELSVQGMNVNRNDTCKYLCLRERSEKGHFFLFLNMLF